MANYKLSFLILVSVVFLSKMALADVAVIVHPSNSLTNVQKKDLMRLYLAKRSHLSGIEVTPVDQPADMPIRKEFYNKVVDKSLFQAKAYWSRMIFTGKGAPPYEFPSSSTLKEWVSGNPQSLGYIDTNDVDDSVKVVHIVK